MAAPDAPRIEQLGHRLAAGAHLPPLVFDDDEVLRVVLDDLEHHLGIRFEPSEIRITRWPEAFAQYRPHHSEWVDAVEAALPSGIFVTGAGFRGIGIPACVRAANSVAARASATAQLLTESR